LRPDWKAELKQLADIPAWEANRDFDPSRGVPIFAFIYRRVCNRPSEKLSARTALAFEAAWALKRSSIFR